MDKNIVFILGILVVIFACQPTIKETETVVEETKAPNSNLSLLFTSQDSIRLPLNESGKLCLNHNLDSLTQLEELHRFFLIDYYSFKTLIHWHPFIGDFNVKEIADNHYQFNGISPLPKNGNWDIPFEHYPCIRYDLKVYDKYYEVIRDKDFDLKLPVDYKKLRELEEYIRSNKTCISKDWKIANECFFAIEKYEYQLFVAILAGDSTAIDAYKSIRTDISIVNAGEFSEYLRGNQIYLALLGKLKIEDVDWQEGLTFSVKKADIPCR